MKVLKLKIFGFLFICFNVWPAFSSPDILVIGIAGGSGSGKTTLVQNIANALGNDVIVIAQDSYYKDLSHLPFEKRGETNFDAPSSIDFPLLISNLKHLKAGQPIKQPKYDFKTHSRLATWEMMQPKKIILVEGILIFTQSELRDLIDIKIFLDVSSDSRLLRRITRDTKERNRTLEDIATQYIKTVEPMYNKYVRPSKKYANIIIPTGGQNHVALQLLMAKTHAHLGQQKEKNLRVN